MALSQIASSAPALYDLARKVGLDYRRVRALRTASRLGWAAAGIAVGGGVALLLAPRSGAEVRAQLATRAQRAKEYVVPPKDERASRHSSRPTR